jgi:hypothetical protein
VNGPRTSLRFKGGATMSTRVTSVLAAVSLVLTLVGPASAAQQLFTSFVNVGEGQFVQCHLTNVSNKDIDVEIELLAVDGTVLRTRQETVGPFQTIGTVSGDPQIQDLLCRFRVPSKNSVRANATVFSSTVALYVVPAQ